MVDEDLVIKIQHLLNKAESTEFEEERNSFLAAAHRLMEKYSIDQSMLNANKVDKGKLTHEVVPIENPYCYEKFALLHTIARQFRCHAVRCNTSTRTHYDIDLIGYEDDMLWVAMMFQSLLIQQAVELSVSLRNDRPNYESKRTFTAAFMTGYTTRIRQRLADLHDDVVREEKNQRGLTAGDQSLELVLIDKNKMVHSYVRELYPSMRTISGGYRRGSGIDAGKSAANRANLGQSQVTGNKGALNA